MPAYKFVYYYVAGVKPRSVVARLISVRQRCMNYATFWVIGLTGKRGVIKLYSLFLLLSLSLSHSSSLNVVMQSEVLHALTKVNESMAKSWEMVRK